MWLIYDKITFTSRITSGPCFLQFRTILVSISYKLYIVTPHGHVPVLILFIFDIADISQNNLFSLLPYLFLSNLTWCFFPSSRLPGAAGLSSLHLCAFSVSGFGPSCAADSRIWICSPTSLWSPGLLQTTAHLVSLHRYQIPISHLTYPIYLLTSSPNLVLCSPHLKKHQNSQSCWNSKLDSKDLTFCSVGFLYCALVINLIISALIFMYSSTFVGLFCCFFPIFQDKYLDCSFSVFIFWLFKIIYFPISIV